MQKIEFLDTGKQEEKETNPTVVRLFLCHLSAAGRKQEAVRAEGALTEETPPRPAKSPSCFPIRLCEAEPGASHAGSPGDAGRSGEPAGPSDGSPSQGSKLLLRTKLSPGGAVGSMRPGDRVLSPCPAATASQLNPLKGDRRPSDPGTASL